MTKEDLKLKLAELNPAATFEEGGEWLNVFVDAADLLSFAKAIRENSDLYFDYLFCLTCVDWPQAPAGKTHLTMVYHFRSTKHNHNIVVKVKLDRTNPEVETVCFIWRTAEFHEREVYEMFGVKFLQHPDLRRLILTDDFEGWPLRKDFEDPINMIKL